MRIITLNLVKFLQAMPLHICITPEIKVSQDIFLRIAAIAFREASLCTKILKPIQWFLFSFSYSSGLGLFC